jgi:hypothetical protein
MENVAEILLALKDQALEATKRKDGGFYRHYLDDSAVAIVPFGVFDKAAIVKQMSSSESPFRSQRIDDTRAIELTPDSGIVTYRATFQGSDGADASSVFVTTIYKKVNGEWKGVFYQQTPMQR